MMNDHIEPLIRISLAMFIGIVLGLNRWLHHKSAGIRTHSLVAIGSALLMLLMASFIDVDAQANSRVLQGLITGIGFLGAGVIIHESRTTRIHGLTTAASIWICALLGATFGAGYIYLGLITFSFIMLVLIYGGVIEKFVGKILKINRESEVPYDQE
jgi:putative Mg2+ transporter-C (MgtC) family protein